MILVQQFIVNHIERDTGLNQRLIEPERMVFNAGIGAAMERLRSSPPASLGGFDVEGVDDLADGSADLPPTDGLRFRLAERSRVVVRPSGTEPKVKCYLEVVVPVEEGEDGAVDAARIVAVQRLDAIRQDLAEAAGL